jgi:histidine ammonia-lyase
MIRLDGLHLDLAAFRAVALEGQPCGLADEARSAMRESAAVVARIAAGEDAVYGINTGFGDLANVRIPSDRTGSLQRRLLLSHAAGVGEPLDDVIVRGMLLLRANALARGHSGIRPEIVDALLRLLEEGMLPVVPSRGSVGASGDLAPLAHLALPLIGHGRLRRAGREIPASEGLAEIGLEPFELLPKEGLALINGTQAMTSTLALATLEARRLARAADLVGALSTDAMRCADTPFDERLHALRPHPGQAASARNLWRLLQGSQIRASHRDHDIRVQDPYSVRCMPQVHGASRDVLDFVEARLRVEFNSVTDNPLIFSDSGECRSGGNFHGEPIAMAADFLAVALTELSSIAERRIEKLTNAHFSGLPAFLVRDAGVNSGFMIAQVTAAALLAESRSLCHPASVDSVPTSADKEDHVSMGMGAALKLRAVLRNCRTVLGIELLAAAQGIDLLRPLRSSAALEALHAALREEIAPWEEDREMAPEIAAAVAFLRRSADPHLEGLD